MVTAASKRQPWYLRKYDNVITAVITFILATGSAHLIERHYHNADEMHRLLQTRSDEFRKITVDFEVLARRYVNSIVTDGSPSSDATRDLADNVVRQINSLDQLRVEVYPEKRVLIDQYRQLLLAFNEQLAYANNVLTMKKFWELVSKIVEVRLALQNTDTG